MPDRFFAPRQTPEPGEIFLDHVGWYVSDIEQAGTAFERLGFRLTPVTPHSHESASGEHTRSGTANRCAMIELGYLEILCAMPGLDTPLVAELRAGLERYAGLHLIAFTCADAVAEHARITAAGFDPRPIVNLRRPIATDDGGAATSAFSVIRLAPGAMAEGRIQMLTQDTPEIVWQPSLIARDNAVDALSGVVVCTEDVDGAAARFARLLGRRAIGGGGAAEIVLDRGRVSLVRPDRLAALIPGAATPSDPFIAAVVLRSRDVAMSRDYLASRGVAVRASAGALLIEAGDAMGATVVIHGHGETWPG